MPPWVRGVIGIVVWLGLCMALGVTSYGAQHVNQMPSGINWSKWGLATGKVNCHELDATAQDGDFEYCSPVDGGPGCIEGSDPCACAPGDITDTGDVFAYRDHGRWRCDGGGSCFNCSDLEQCIPACAVLGDVCTNSGQCCEGFCVDGICVKPCLPTGAPCLTNADCCVGICVGEICLGPPTTVVTTSTTSSSTTTTSTSTTTLTTSPVPTTTSTSSSITTSTSTSSTTTTFCAPTTTLADFAPNWDQVVDVDGVSGAVFMGVWHYECEEVQPAHGAAPFSDSSGHGNTLQIQTHGGTGTFEPTTVYLGQGSYIARTFLTGLSCADGTGTNYLCHPDDMQGDTGSFTVGEAFNATTNPGGGPGAFESFILNTIPLFAGTTGWGLAQYSSGGTNHFELTLNNSGTLKLVTAVSTWSTGQWRHQTARYRSDFGRGEQLIDGTLDANTVLSANPSNSHDFGSGSLAGRVLPGYHDEGFFFRGALDDTTVCRIAVCGTWGRGCTCDVGDPTVYTSAPKSSDFGGPIHCTLPACNADPHMIVTTTTSTTTSTTTTT